MQSKRLSSGAAIIFLVLSFVGFLDAGYLTVSHYLNMPARCSIVSGCNDVLTSKYASFGSIPVALIGAMYYLAVFLLSIAYLDSRNSKFFRFAFFLVCAGFAASLGFVLLQLFVIRAICLYCMASAAISTVLCIVGTLALTTNPRDYV